MAMNLGHFVCLTICLLVASSYADVNYMQPGETFTYKQGDARSTLEVFCYKGRPKYIIHIWQSVILHIDLNSDNYIQYDGSTPEAVKKEFLAHRSSWSPSLFSWKQKNLKLNPFNQSCVGIYSGERYSVHLHMIRIDYWKVCSLILGILLLVSGPKLSRNTIFYYLCGITFGICASFLILIYGLSRLFPKRPVMYGVIIGGWAVGVYMLQILWDNVRVIMTTYRMYVMWYAFATGLFSFVVCYRFGPVTNKRTQKLMQWAIQALGLILVFHSSEFQEAAMGQVVVFLIVYNFPKSWVLKSKTYWKRRFPPKVRLLTNDEYYQQGVRETTKALSELKAHCLSPECNQWKTALKIKDVKRFASFMEGTSHLSDEEILEYESSMHQTELTDDEEDYTDEDDGY